MLEVKIHIVAPELVSAISALLGSAAAAAPKPVEKAAPKPATAKTEDKPKDEPKADTGGQSVDEKRKEATRLLQEINKKNGIEAVRGVLAEFGVANVSAIDEGKLDEAIATFRDKIA